MSKPRQVFVAVIGVGGVGAHFLDQLATLSTRLSHRTPPVHLSLILVARSSKLVLSESYAPIPISSWQSTLDASSQPVLAPAQIAEYLSCAPGGAVLVDNTSSADLAAEYPTFLRRGVCIVTPNKKAFSAGYAAWRDIFDAAASPGGGHVFHEATVGAGLPVISTLRDLVETGDRVTRIEGVFSGTMSFLFNSFMPVGGGGGRFSEEVARAKELGYTEPDPRDDLNGLDVARKLTILARLVGLEVESPTSFPVESLIPKQLEGCRTGEEFLQRLGESDDVMTARRREAEEAGKVLRYVGAIDVAKRDVSVSIVALPESHPVAGLKGSDNIINFYTERYGDKPLIIQGAGAGGAVTAMGVTADLIKVVNLLH